MENAHGIFSKKFWKSKMMVSALLIKKFRDVLNKKWVEHFADEVISLQVKGDTVLITTNKPALNARLRQYDSSLKESWKEVMKNPIRTIVYL